jgi:hypothetical protein
MARRAGLLASVRSGKPADAVLVLGGPWEFKAPGAPAPAQESLKAIARSFEMMGYDMGLLSPEEAHALSAGGVSLPGWHQTENAGALAFFPSPVGRVAVIAFPMLDGGALLPGKGQVETVRTLAATARARADLIVALSPWGAQAERFLLERAAPGIRIDVLLGAGNGSSQAGQIANRGRTLWMRPYDKGRTVMRVTIGPLTGAPGERAWVPGTNIDFRMVPLLPNVPEHEAVGRLFSGLP